MSNISVRAILPVLKTSLLSSLFTFGVVQNAIAASTLVTDAVGTQELWEFEDVLGVQRLTSKINQVDGKGVTQTWDANGNMLTRTDSEGRVTSYTYNTTNQRLTMTEAVGTPQERLTSYEYINAEVDLVTRTSSPSIFAGNFKEVINTYDNNLNITSVRISGFDALGGPVSRESLFEYDSFGKVTRIDGPRTDISDVTVLEYYNCNSGAECGQLRKVTNAAGHVSSYDSYDAVSRLTQSTDANGVVTSYTYHPRGWILSMVQTPPTGAARVTVYDYDNVGQLIKTILPAGTELNYVYDAAHDLREVFDNLGNRVTYTYDAKGNRIEELVSDPDGTLVLSTITSYDIRNFIESINNGGSVTQLINDAVGNLSTQTDPNVNPSTETSFDALDRLRETVDALTNTSSYQYDVADQLTEVVSLNGSTTQYEYDDLGNKTKEISPDRGVIIYTHDDAGNIASMSDARGITVNYEYDALNRMTSRRYPDASEDIFYTYDAQLSGDSTDNICGAGVGRLCQMVDPSGQSNYSYDVWGNVLAKTKQEVAQSGATNTDTQTYITQYSYDDENRVVQQTNPNGLLITYTRDAIGRINDIDITYQGETNSLLAGRTYRADNLATGHVLGNGLADTRQYDLQGRLISQTLGEPYSKGYAYDANGNVLSQDINPDPVLRDKFVEQGFADQSYSYDVLDRIINENSVLGVLDFTYDGNGNRLSKARNNTVRPYDYNTGSNQLLSINNKPITLDEVGNTLSDRNNKRQYGYNQRNQLETIIRNGQLRGVYQYNANNQRTSKQRTNKSGTQRTFHYQYDQLGNLISEYRQRNNGDYAPQHSYVWLNNEPVAQITFRQNDSQTIKHITYITTDHLNTPRIGTDDAGQIVWRWESDAFGQAQPDRDPDGDTNNRNIRLRFPGQYRDSESGLNYNWNRYYDPVTGRYVTSDPIGLGGGLNTYGYVDGNPLGFSDPEGLAACGGVCIGIGVGVIRGVTLIRKARKASAAAAAAERLKRAADPGDPDSDKCKRLAQKIENLENEIFDKRIPDLESNPGNLPERIGPGERLRDTVRGHRKLLDRQIRRLKELQDRYDRECKPQQCE